MYIYIIATIYIYIYIYNLYIPTVEWIQMSEGTSSPKSRLDPNRV